MADIKSHLHVRKRRLDFQKGDEKKRKKLAVNETDAKLLKVLDSPPRLKVPPVFTITAKQCVSPKKISPTKTSETRAEALLRISREKYRQPSIESPSASQSPRKQPQLEKFDTVVFTSPQKKLRKPAYERFSSLAQPTTPPKGSLPAKPDLSLPHEYQLLEDMFQSIESICSRLQSRSEMCTFSKLKREVQHITKRTKVRLDKTYPLYCNLLKQAEKRNFELKHLAQIKFVYPDAYIFRQEQNVRSFTNQSSQHQLTIECTSHKGMDNEEEGVMKPLPAGKGLQFSSLVKRKRLLHQRLQQIAIEHHKKFLLSLDPPVLVSDDKMYRWHPRFDLDYIPSVPEADLPQPPHTDEDIKKGSLEFWKNSGLRFPLLQQLAKRYLSVPATSAPIERVFSTAGKILKQDRNRLLPQNFERLLFLKVMVIEIENNKVNVVFTAKDVLDCTKAKVMDKTRLAMEAVGASKQKEVHMMPTTSVSIDSTLKGVSSALLARVRLKEATRVKADIMRNPVMEKKLGMIDRMPEMCRIIRSLYTTEGKAALLLEVVVKKISESHTSKLSTSQVEEHVDLFMTLVDWWITKIYLRKTEYLKLLKKDANVGNICKILEEKKEELKA